MACSYFPEDLMIEILKRLLVNSLLRFQCVSKSWKALIRSPNFVSEHRIFSNGRPSSSDSQSQSIIVLDSINFFWKFSGDNLQSKERLGYFPWNHDLVMYGCCDGIVCAGVGETLILLWNPATREYKSLPPSCICIADSNHVFNYDVIRFGFDPKNNDYKVVRIVSHWYKLEHHRVEVYSMRSNSWREIKPLEACVVPRNRYDPDLCINGLLFWNCTGVSKILSILVFGIGEEEFKVIDMPPSLNSPDCYKFNQSSIAVLDRLSAINHIDVWVMENVEFKNLGSTSSWVKHFTISCPCSPYEFCSLGFTSNGELLCYPDCSELVSYSPTDHRFKSLNEGDVPGINHFVCYKESLAPVEGENELKL